MQKQLDKLRDHLKRGKTITQLEALQKYGIGRLSARILDLKEEGMAIESKRVKKKTANGESYVACYKLVA